MEDTSLLVSDVDNTLLGDDRALERFAEWLAANRRRIRLVYSSGRFPESVQDSIARTALPAPDAIIGGVGTEIRLLPGGKPVPAWPPAERWDAALVHRTVRELEGIEPQPAEQQSAYKASFFARQWSEARLAVLRGKLAAAGLAAEVVYSSQRDLDILPAGVDKGSAAAFLAAHWRFSAERVIVCGDSGNDLAMFQYGFRGVVVANAHPELRALRGAVRQAESAYAAGVLEGVLRWLGG